MRYLEKELDNHCKFSPIWGPRARSAVCSMLVVKNSGV